MNMYEYMSSPSKRDPVQKIKFTREEDNILRNAVLQFGTSDWQLIANCLPGRNIRQCRERWNNYVNPEIIVRPWSMEEDKILLEKYERYGPRWHMITSCFQNRSVNNVKNRYLTLKRREAKNNNTNSTPSPIESKPMEQSPTLPHRPLEPQAPRMQTIQSSLQNVFEIDDSMSSLLDDFGFTDLWF